MRARFEAKVGEALLATLTLKPILIDPTEEAQKFDLSLMNIVDEVKKGEKADFILQDNVILLFGNRLCIPNDQSLKREILEEGHSSAYAMHPGSTMLYRNLREHYWWPGMKR